MQNRQRRLHKNIKQQNVKKANSAEQMPDSVEIHLHLRRRHQIYTLERKIDILLHETRNYLINPDI